MEKQVKQNIEELDLDEFIPKNSSVSDFRQTYLKKVSKSFLDSSTDIHKELICKYDMCDKLLNIYLKREILTKLSRVRYKMSNELWDVKEKTEEMKLTPRMKSFLQIISERGFEFLEKEGIFQDFVEIDNSSETNVLHNGKLRKLSLNLDVICPIENQEVIKPVSSSVDKIATGNGIPDPKSTEPIKSNNYYENMPLIERPPKGILKRTKHVDLSVSAESKMPQNVIELDSESDDENSSYQDLEIDQKYDTLILNFVLSTRRSIPAITVFKQFLSKLVFPKPKNLMMVFHVGPLIKDQEIVLYEYICNKDLMKLDYDTLHERGDTDKQHQGNQTENWKDDTHLQNPQYLGPVQIPSKKDKYIHPRNPYPGDNKRLCSTKEKDIHVPTKDHHYINVDPLVDNWIEHENKLVHTFCDSRDSVKDSIFEYQGLGKLQNPKIWKREKLHKAKVKTEKSKREKK